MDKKLKIELNSNKKIMFNCDGDLLARAFGNLIKNAINYSYQKTTIEIHVKETEEIIEMQFKNKGDEIPSYKLEKIFEKFYRADEARNSSSGGAGLGLPITKEIIELHGGTIKVSSGNGYIIFKIVLKK